MSIMNFRLIKQFFGALKMWHWLGSIWVTTPSRSSGANQSPNLICLNSECACQGLITCRYAP